MRVTARKDVYGEVEEFICNTCRFDKKKTADWVIEGPRKISNHSVISSNHYDTLHPLPVIKNNPVLIEANQGQFERNTRL